MGSESEIASAPGSQAAPEGDCLLCSAERVTDWHFEDDACPPGRHLPALAWRVAMPGAGHAQMGVQRQTVVEADDHVFSKRLNGGDVAANDALDCGTGCSRLRGQNLTTNQERPQGSGGLKDRVAFRHSPRSAPLHGAGVPPGDGSRLASAASARGTRV